MTRSDGAPLTVDALVVGAGPAGSSAARVLAAGGAAVLLVDERPRIGEPIQCAEHVAKIAVADLSLPGRAVVQSSAAMETWIDGEAVAVTPAPGYILDRSVFDMALAEEAALAGARVWVKTRALAREGGVVHCRRGDRPVTLRPRLIVGADGPRSVVASWIGQRPAAVCPSLQERHLLAEERSHSLVFLDRRFRGGYGWLFPRGRVANVGLGVAQEAGLSLPALLDRFVAELCDRGLLRRASCVGRYGGLIPVAGPAARSAADGVLLAGDAAGACHPITGAGIAAAVETGKLAGAHGLAWLDQPSDVTLTSYDRAWKDALALPLVQGRERRAWALQHWDDEDFNSVARRTWVAFPEYYRAAGAALGPKRRKVEPS